MSAVAFRVSIETTRPSRSMRGGPRSFRTSRPGIAPRGRVSRASVPRNAFRTVTHEHDARTGGTESAADVREAQAEPQDVRFRALCRQPRHPDQDMSGSALRAWVPWLVSLIAMVIGIALIITTPPDRVPVGFRTGDVFSYLLLPLSSATVGAVVAWRRPHNAVGWLLAAVGWISSWQYLTAGYAVHGLFGEVRLPMAEASAWAFTWSGMLVGPILGNLFVRFPDGRIGDRGGRFSSLLVIPAAAFAFVAVAFREGPLVFFREVANPFGVAGADAVFGRS
jgi:hypothetical protein